MSISIDRRRWGLLIGAMGVVYGDIGTSPLYAVRECFAGPHGIAPEPAHVMGVISLMAWSLMLVVTLKYVTWILRADNRGEGGILALLSLALRGRASGGAGPARAVMALGLCGAALLYGDGMLTPAVTVLGAVEGLEVATPALKPYVVPLALLIVGALFSVQRFGTGRVGGVFGPAMLLWFLVLAALGVRGIAMAPRILAALSPHHALAFLLQHGASSLPVLGSVFLVVTGAEALYADLGHFGAPPIRRAWFAAVFPALLLNYLGEGALLLVRPEAAANPFFLLAPRGAVLPLVALSTAAAVIASQALISGAYSLTMQAVQMGLLPRLLIRHTSRSERGQVYLPQVNALLMIVCMALVLGFGSSSRLAGAYGIAVSLTMLATTLLLHGVARRTWGWSRLRAGLVCGGFALLEAGFVAANGLKVGQGGWFPLLAGAAALLLMTTWRTGRERLRARMAEHYLPLELFLRDLDERPALRVPGAAVFLSGNPDSTPPALLHNLKHNRVLHERIVVLTVVLHDTAAVEPAQRLRHAALRPDVHRVEGHYGYLEQPDVPALLRACRDAGLACDEAEATYFLSRETLVLSGATGWARWRRRLFAAMSRNAQPATAFFCLPPNRVVELGMHFEI